MRVLLILLALMTALPMLQPVAAVAGSLSTLVRLEQSIRAAMAHTDSLREDLHRESVVNPAAEIAGIADGGVRSSLAALRLTARSIDRRLETLRLTLAGESLKHVEILLAMRRDLATLAWAIEAIPPTLEDPTAGRRELKAALLEIEQALTDLDGAATALAALD